MYTLFYLFLLTLMAPNRDSQSFFCKPNPLDVKYLIEVYSNLNISIIQQRIFHVLGSVMSDNGHMTCKQIANKVNKIFNVLYWFCSWTLKWTLFMILTQSTLHSHWCCNTNIYVLNSKLFNVQTRINSQKKTEIYCIYCKPERSSYCDYCAPQLFILILHPV